jgi:hypothetical protein
LYSFLISTDDSAAHAAKLMLAWLCDSMTVCTLLSLCGSNVTSV